MSFCYQSNNLVDSHQVWFIKGSFHIWELELLKPLGLRLAVTLFYFSLPTFFWDIYLHSIGLLSVKSALAMTFFFQPVGLSVITESRNKLIAVLVTVMK